MHAEACNKLETDKSNMQAELQQVAPSRPSGSDLAARSSSMPSHSE